MTLKRLVRWSDIEESKTSESKSRPSESDSNTCLSGQPQKGLLTYFDKARAYLTSLNTVSNLSRIDSDIIVLCVCLELVNQIQQPPQSEIRKLVGFMCNRI
mmetsp:Transcript_73195/g.107423  ORF Transcript_73195/g.107423 Transcript_73195/m.107423 type:complete len:101 (+) Transcript_73195:89-391(+)